MDATTAFLAEIYRKLGHAPEAIEPGKLHRFATSDKRGDKAGYCHLYADQRGGYFGDHRSGIKGHWQAEQHRDLTPADKARMARDVAQARAKRHAEQQAQWARNAQRIERLWRQCFKLTPGDPVTLYLKRRGMDPMRELPAELRYCPSLVCWDDAGNKLGEFPAMVAPLVAPDGRTVALHRTWLTRDGRKADVPEPKKLTPACGPLAGACIPLHDKPVRGVMGIAEGIETALAAGCMSGVPTVAAYCANNLAAWRWPAGVQRLVIFADADNAGRGAADTLRARAMAAHLRVQVIEPSDEGADWCDVWKQSGAAMPAAAKLHVVEADERHVVGLQP